MEILIAENSGFCYGVERAYDLAKAQKNGRIFTWGQLIHNSQIVEELEKQGVYSVDSLENLKQGDIVILRAHGISENLRQKIESKGVKIIDGTCPFVKKAHLIAQKTVEKKWRLVIIGDKNHPEIQGIQEDFPQAIVIQNQTEVKNFKTKLNKQPMGIICQTTIQPEKAKKIVDLIQEISPSAIFENTVCNATHTKQNSAKELAKKVDVMLIVGGKNSNNTKMLQEICSEICPSYLISEAKEIQAEWLKNCQKIGLTGGASTPMWLIEKVKEWILKNCF